MAINLPIVTQFSDKGLKSAKAAFANFKTDVGAATGAMGKFKAGGNAALDAVKANAGTFALAGGAALAGFAAKGVEAFMDLALASGKFADSTGLSVQEASRFIEVGDDIGIEAGLIESSLGKLNRAIGLTPEAFKDARVESARTSSGAVDVQKTFLNVVQRLNEIKDPAERAAVASKLLGRGWQGMSELIASGADKIVDSLAAVSDSKVITPDELFKAKELREAKDRYSDWWDDVLITTGSGMATLAREYDEAGDPFTGFMNMFGVVADPLDAFDRRIGDSEARAKDFWERVESGAYIGEKVILPLAEDFGEVEESITELSTEWQLLLGKLDTREAFDNLEESLGALLDAGVKAFGGTEQEVRDFNAAQKDAIDLIADIAIAMGLTFGEQNKLKILVDSGDLEGARRLLEQIQRLANIGSVYDGAIERLLDEKLKGKAAGGPVSGGTSYLVGEKGPEIFTPSGSGMITPNSAIGGSTMTINVLGADPQAVVRALQDYNRTSGPIPINTRAN